MGATVSVAPFAEKRDSLLFTESLGKIFSRQASFGMKLECSICEYEDRMFRIMTSDVKVRELFVKYIKLGQWMDAFREAPEASLMESLMSTLKLPEFVKPTVVTPSEEELETTTSVSVSSARDNIHKRTPTSSNSSHGTVKIGGIPLSRAHSLKSLRSGGGGSAKDLHEGARLSSHPFAPVQHGTSWSSMATSSNRTAHSTGSSYETGFREPFHTREMLSLLFVCLYPLFLESRIYQAHFQCRRNIAITGSQQFQLSDFANLVSVDSDDYVGNSADEQLRKDGSGHAMSLFLEAANAFDTDQITAILSNPLWLHVHRPSEIVANAHVSVCVFSASFNQPVIYVNKAYEKLTGYTAKEVIGNPSRLAQESRVASGETDTSESPCSLTEALTSGKPTKLEMHGKTKAGKDLNNYMILTPVFELNSEILSYVVCVQFDTLEKDVTVREMQVARDVLAIVPYLLLH